jgi:endonuclease-3
MNNSLAKRRARATQIHLELTKLFPHAGMMLNFSNHWELVLAVSLSAQCTDKKVNEVTEKLFKKYPTLNDYLTADLKEFERDIFQTGFYHQKAKNALAAARVLHDRFAGVVPNTMEELMELPGVGRKTANVVLGNAFGIAVGIAVDTHVNRLARVFGLTKNTDPEKIEQDLMKIIPQEEWFQTTYLYIEYGRRYCIARPHAHENCPVK